MQGDTPASIVNRALEGIAGQTGVIGTPGTFTAADGSDSSASIAANLIYTPAFQTLLRSQDWEFALTDAAMVQYPATPLPYPTFYYPTDCARIRQVAPVTVNVNDPAPTRWNVVTLLLADVQTRFIIVTTPGFTNTAPPWSGRLWYQTTNSPEAQWDGIFTEAMVRYLGSELAMPVGGRPDFSREKLAEAGQMMTSGVARDQ